MEKIPRVLIAGDLKTEYLISASGKKLVDQPGGNLLYAASGANLWSESNQEIGLLSKIGSNFPEKELEKISKKGFNTDGIVKLDQQIEHRDFIAYSDLRTSHSNSPISFFSKTEDKFPESLLGYSANNKNTPKTDKTKQALFYEKDLPEEYRFANAIHFCPLDKTTHHLFPDVFRRENISFISLDPSAEYMQPTQFNELSMVLQGLSAFIPSEKEIRNLFRGRSEDIWEMMEELGNMGCNLIVVKSGEDGQKLYNSDSKKKYHIPAFPSKLVDLTGAGDVFCGGFIAGLEKTNDPLEAVLWGNIAASFAVEGSGAFYTDGVMEGLQFARLDKLRSYLRKI